MKPELRRGIVFGVLILCVIFVLAGIILGKPARRGVQELVGPDKIAVINVLGPITSGETSGTDLFGRGASAKRIIEQLKRAAADSSIKAVVLRVNTPGGSVVASQEIYAEIMRLKATGRYVLVSMGDSATSGGYYISVPAHYIFANPSTFTGNIGAIMEVQDLTGIYDKLGVDHKVFKSGKLKDVGNPLREMTSEDEELLQALVDDAFDEFITVVAEGRNLSVDTVREIADGRILTGRQALELGLVDALGGLEDTIDYARKLAGLSPNAPVVEFKEKRSIMTSLLNFVNTLQFGIGGNLADYFFSELRLLYMYDSRVRLNMIF